LIFAPYCRCQIDSAGGDQFLALVWDRSRALGGTVCSSCRVSTIFLRCGVLLHLVEIFVGEALEAFLLRWLARALRHLVVPVFVVVDQTRMGRAFELATDLNLLVLGEKRINPILVVLFISQKCLLSLEQSTLVL